MHDDAAITNEQVLKEMLSNDVYADFLLAKNNKLNYLLMFFLIIILF